MPTRGGIRGVNLGNWLVLEKWMGNSPLARAASPDDRGLIEEVDPSTLARALEEHRSTYIRERDFRWLGEVGVNLVRIPVPYHLFGTAHHGPCVYHLDQAFAWAEKYGIGVLVDLHTVPCSQNSFDNGGYLGLCAWARDPGRISFALDVLERIALRYAGHRALWGVEVLNEPASRSVLAHNLKKTVGRYPERAARSRAISHRALRSFYTSAYARLRPILGPEPALVFHDHFRLASWKWEFRSRDFENVVLDTHCYLNFSEDGFRRFDADEYLGRVAGFARDIERASQRHQVLVGEWSLANHSPLVGRMDARGRRVFYRTLADAQLAAWDLGLGGVYWSYRVDDPKRQAWSLRHAIEQGWLCLRSDAR